MTVINPPQHYAMPRKLRFFGLSGMEKRRMPLRFTMSVSYQYSEQFLCGLNLQSNSGCPKTEQGRYYRVPNEQPASALYAFYPREKDFYALSIEERGLTGACFFGTFKSAEHHLPMGYHGQYLINRACNT